MTKASEVTVSDADYKVFTDEWMRQHLAHENIERADKAALAAFLAARVPDASAVSGANSIYRNGFNSCRDAVLRGAG